MYLTRLCYVVDGIVPSNAPSDDEDALPTASLTAPFEALAEAAAAAASGSATPVHKGRFKKRQRRMPPPPNAFPVSSFLILRMRFHAELSLGNRKSRTL